MKTASRIMLLSLLTAVLGACASTAETAQVPDPATQLDQIDEDSLYIARVEAIARRRGVHVQWVNPPTRRTKAEDNQ